MTNFAARSPLPGEDDVGSGAAPVGQTGLSRCCFPERSQAWLTFSRAFSGNRA